MFSTPCYQTYLLYIFCLRRKINPYLHHIFCLRILTSGLFNNNCVELNRSREASIRAYPRNSSPFMEFKMSVPYSKVPALSWARYILSKVSLPPSYLCMLIFNIILPSTTHEGLSSGLFPSALAITFFKHLSSIVCVIITCYMTRLSCISSFDLLTTLKSFQGQRKLRNYHFAVKSVHTLLRQS